MNEYILITALNLSLCIALFFIDRRSQKRHEEQLGIVDKEFAIAMCKYYEELQNKSQ